MLRVPSFLLLLALLAGLPMSSASAAGRAATAAVVVEQAYSYETAAPGVTAAGFLSIRNKGKKADRLLAAESPWAGSVEIHEMSMDSGVMKMRALAEGLVIPAGSTVQLAPGGIHLMLFGSRQAFSRGQKIPLTLRFAKARAVVVMLDVLERPAAE